MTLTDLIKIASAFGRFSEASQNQMKAFRAGDEAAMMRYGQTVQDIKNQFGGHQPPGRMPDPMWQVARQNPESFIHPTAGPQTMPGYTQIDDVTGGVNRWSSNPETLARKGYRLPDFSKLPTGRFQVGPAAHSLWQNSYLGRGSLSPLAHGYPQLEAALALAQKMGPSPELPLLAGRSGVDTMSAMKSWRRATQRAQPEFNQAFRRFSSPGALKFLTNAAKAIR